MGRSSGVQRERRLGRDDALRRREGQPVLRSSHNWDDDRYAVLSGHVFLGGSEHTLLELLAEAGFINPEFIAAYEEAQGATARFLRQVFLELAQGWKQFRAYAAAYEHGLLFVPTDIGDVVDEDDNVIPTHY